MPSLRTRSAILLAMFGLLLAAAAPARADQPPGPDGEGSDLFVTIAARECPSYTDITANRARNNIQESLRDLGPDTPYTDGQVVDLTTEQTAQPNCTPITGWHFTLGTGIGGPVTGPWGSLSIVTGAYGTDITTLASVPERDARGRPIALRTVQGATTIELTADQAQRAGASGTQLWIQGGTPTDPVLAQEHPDAYGFGALRCATDNVNGDNVEYIKFPTGSRHVYCFAYYVTPPPTSGTIVVRKAIDGTPGTGGTFTFEGNVSYTADQRFDLPATTAQPGVARFYRAESQAGHPPWTVRELVPDGWSLTDLACTAGGSTVVVSKATASVAIALLAGDTVTCTFTDAVKPPRGGLLIAKVTRGSVGTFGYRVEPVSGGTMREAEATTKEEGTPVAARPAPLRLDPGRYLVTEDLPDAAGGRWRQTAVHCNGRERATTDPVEVTIAQGAGVACLFENRFVPAGALTIAKVTHGATGTTGFVISPLRGPVREYQQTARTRREDVPAVARGDATSHLRLGRYAIQETGTTSDDAGRWTLTTVVCGGAVVPFAQGRAVVRLTADHPRLRCVFRNVFEADVPPVPPEPPGPTPEPPGPTPSTLTPNLVVTKRASPTTVQAGGTARFTITVRNTGDAAAEEVVLADSPTQDVPIASVTTSQGTCTQARPIVCRLGTLEPGAQATIRVRLGAVGVDAIDNVAVAGSATPETRLDDNTGRARVTVAAAGGVAGEVICTSARTVAHAAC